MEQVTTTISVDSKIKRDVEELFESMGIDINTAVNIFFRQCLIDEAIPFQLKRKRDPSRDLSATRERETPQQAKINGTEDMTADEINAIISECSSRR